MSKHLTVRVISAKNLIAADRGGTSDPYAKIRVGTTERKTRTIKKCLNPKWDETFRFTVANPKTSKVIINVWDKDTFTRDDPLGSVTIPLNNLERGVELVDWYNLTGVRSGQIQLGLTAVDFGVPPGTANPYGDATAYKSNYTPASYPSQASTYPNPSQTGYPQTNTPYQTEPTYPQQGYPQQVYNQPQAGGYPQSGGYTQPQTGGYNQPQAGYNQSQSGYGQPQSGGYTQPQTGGYGQPQSGNYNQYQSGYGQPQSSGYNQPHSNEYNQPQSGGYNAAQSYAQPQQNYAQAPPAYPNNQQQSGVPAYASFNPSNQDNVPSYISGRY